MPQASMPPLDRCFLTASAYITMVGANSNASKFTISTPASICAWSVLSRRRVPRHTRRRHTPAKTICAPSNPVTSIAPILAEAGLEHGDDLVEGCVLHGNVG